MLNRQDIKELVTDCYLDPVLFCKTMFPNIFIHDIPWFHRGLMALVTGQMDFLDEYGDLGKIQDHFIWEDGSPVFDLTIPAIVNGLGQYNLVLLPTGCGATTLAGLVFPIRNILYQEAHFTGYVTAHESDGRAQLTTVRKQLTENKRILSTFGDLSPQSSTITSPRSDFFEATTGYAAASAGFGSRVRSLSYNNKKPDFIFCDKVEDREQTSDENKRRRLRTWFYGELMGDVPFLYFDRLKNKESLAVVLARDPDCQVLRFGIRDKSGAPLWPAVMNEEKIQSRRRSLALAGQENSFVLEYENIVPGEAKTDFYEEYIETLGRFLTALEALAREASPELFKAHESAGNLPPPALSWLTVLEHVMPQRLGEAQRLYESTSAFGSDEKASPSLWERMPEALASLVPVELRLLVEGDWRFVGRREQLSPLGVWSTWLYMAGRGSGKTRSGAEWVIDKVRHGFRRIAIVAPTAADTRDVIVEGESGILAVSSDRDRPTYETSKRRLTWPNGAIATLFSAEEPERLRGPQHDAAWCDETAAWKYPQQTWDMLMFGLRLGQSPQVMVSTTPRPIKLIRELHKRWQNDKGVVLTSGSTYDNIDNLAPTFRQQILERYEGTALGQQEIEGRLLEDLEGALWSRSTIEKNYVDSAPEILNRIVVGVDPPIASDEASAEAGIVVCGKKNDKGYVLSDVSMRGKPEKWARTVVRAYHDFDADLIVAEKNQGGEMVRSTIHAVDPDVPIKLVHAAKGKIARAEPISAFYEQRRFKHVGAFPELEDEMCTYVAGDSESPNRLDALVWAATDLMVGSGKRAGVWGRNRRKAA